MAWQSDGLDASGAAVRPRIEDIDPLTNIIGTGLSAPEPLLWMTLYPLSIGGLRERGRLSMDSGNTPAGRRWRSIRTPLGPSGSDLSRVENIEFWAQIPVSAARRSRNPTLILDFGDVSENSVAFAPDTLRVTPRHRQCLRRAIRRIRARSSKDSTGSTASAIHSRERSTSE